MPRAIWPRTWSPQVWPNAARSRSYAIGVAKPLSIYVDTHGTGKVPEAVIEKAVAEVMDLTPRGIRTHLDLNRPIYARTSAYGHFGRAPEADGGFSWERTDLVEALKKAV
jgi:S-adenosylmethionine synthetase